MSTGISGLSAFHESHEQRQSVEATMIADAMNEYGITKLDFLKVDTEGYDLFVLKGVDWANGPDVIVCEFEDKKTVPLGYSLVDMYGYLQERGYEVTISEWHPIVEYGRQHRWKAFASLPSEVGSEAWGNLIAFRGQEYSEFAIGNVERLAKRVFPAQAQ